MTKARLKTLRSIFAQLYRQAEAAGVAHWFDQAYEAELKGEREHRAFGARFTDGRARYRHSCADAARLFVCKWVIEGMSAPKGWAATCDVRAGARLGYAVHERIEAYRLACPEQHWASAAWPMFDYDYTTDIAAGCADAAA